MPGRGIVSAPFCPVKFITRDDLPFEFDPKYKIPSILVPSFVKQMRGVVFEFTPGKGKGRICPARYLLGSGEPEVKRHQSEAKRKVKYIVINLGVSWMMLCF